MLENLQDVTKIDETQKNEKDLESLRGVFSKYARPELLDLENGVWERTILDKCIQNAFVAADKPVFIENSNDKFLEPLKFNISFFEEEDGSFTGTLEELDLIENTPSKEDCLLSLIEAMKDYAHDFYNEFALWSSAPNRKSHIPYVLKILSSSNNQLMENIVCRNGKS